MIDIGCECGLVVALVDLGFHLLSHSRFSCGECAFVATAPDIAVHCLVHSHSSPNPIDGGLPDHLNRVMDRLRRTKDIGARPAYHSQKFQAHRPLPISTRKEKRLQISERPAYYPLTPAPETPRPQYSSPPPPTLRRDMFQGVNEQPQSAEYQQEPYYEDEVSVHIVTQKPLIPNMFSPESSINTGTRSSSPPSPPPKTGKDIEAGDLPCNQSRQSQKPEQAPIQAFSPTSPEFSCNTCQTSNVHKLKLVDHVLSKCHGVFQEPSYKCRICDAKLWSEHTLYKHSLKAHRGAAFRGSLLLGREEVLQELGRAFPNQQDSNEMQRLKGMDVLFPIRYRFLDTNL